MSQGSRSTTPRVNRRASRRSPLRGTVRVECRKGALGLGPDLVKFPLDISETGVRLVLKVELGEGQEVEVLISGGHGKPLKRTARVIWSVPTENNCHVVGVRFDGHLPFAELQGVTRPLKALA
jgi:PilZ domain